MPRRTASRVSKNSAKPASPATQYGGRQQPSRFEQQGQAAARPRLGRRERADVGEGFEAFDDAAGVGRRQPRVRGLPVDVVAVGERAGEIIEVLGALGILSASFFTARRTAWRAASGVARPQMRASWS